MNNRAHDRQQPIAVFDSGVGGLPYLRWMKQHLPDERFVYLADRANFPYGEKTEDELRGIVIDTVGRLIEKQDPKIAVIACNTASVVALADLRATYSIPFVGVVPAVKPAAEISDSKSIGILATRRTVEDPYTDDLVRSYARDCSVSRYAGVEIVDLVENRFFSTSREEKREILRPAVEFFRERNVDTVVVACTHFIFVQDELRKMLGPEAHVIDSREGVGRQVVHILKERQLQSPAYDFFGNAKARGEKTGGEKTGGEKNGSCFFVTRKQDELQYRRFAADYALQWGGVL